MQFLPGKIREFYTWILKVTSKWNEVAVSPSNTQEWIKHQVVTSLMVSA